MSESQEKSAKAQVPATEKPVEASLEAQEPEKSPEPSPDADAEEAVAVSERQSDVDLLVTAASQRAEEKISSGAPQDARDPEIEAALLDLEEHATEESSLSEEEIASVASMAQEETESLQADTENAEAEFPGVSSMPKGCYEPWGLFRKPLPDKMTVAQCLREYQTGALRRTFDDKPFEDLIPSERTPRRERDIVDYPSLKPQSFMRQVCYAALPLGEGVIVDPFAGSGSTIAAAEAFGLCGIGIERHPDYYKMACDAIPRLKRSEIPKVDRKVGVPSKQRSLF